MTKFLNISTDNTLGGSSASDEIVSSQKAIKGYVDGYALHNTASYPEDGLKVLGASSVSGHYATVIGVGADDGGYGGVTAIGYNSGRSSSYVQNATALGANAKVGKDGAIQIGAGTNSESCSLSIGFRDYNNTDVGNYKLLGSTGLIPIERLGGNSSSTDSKFLKEDGSWATVSGGGWTPPSQTGNAGKFLTTDGTDTSWGEALTNKATGDASFSINSSIGNYVYAITTATSYLGQYSTLFGYNAASGGNQYSTCIGANSVSGGQGATCLGYDTHAAQNGVSLGRGAGGSSGNQSNYSICIGNSSMCRGESSVAVGYGSAGGSSSSNTYCTGIGAYAKANAAKSIQIGYGTNSEASTMYVGSQGGTNYKLLDLSTGNIPIARLGATSGDTSKFLKGDGTWADVGGSSYTPNLFDNKWSDYILNDQSWLRADTFSWQDGTVYSDAYSHLVSDYQGGTSQTETVGSYTITYVLATDGHKITTDETTVQNIYAESGVAWYYVLDTTNQRFKLPRSSHGNLVEKYQNGSNWYRVYSDGWCEQGGVVSLNECSTVVVNYSKVFANTNYSLSAIQTNLSTATDTEVGIQFTPTSTSQGTLSCHYINPNTTTVSWKVCGYLSTVPANSQYKHLYFYVGQFSQTATEQTAGLNSELFNGKVDLNLNNMNPSATAKETIVGWGAIDYDSGVTVSSSPYVPPKDGLFVLQSDGSDDMTIIVNGNVIQHVYYSQIQDLMFSVPVGKGDIVTYVAQGRGTQAAFFYPVKGG